MGNPAVPVHHTRLVMFSQISLRFGGTFRIKPPIPILDKTIFARFIAQATGNSIQLSARKLIFEVYPLYLLQHLF